ncbi:NAD-dependent epimerase/dehydratase family protein [Bacillus salitolerans]|uniref:NAD-dependent epimerase/dehydratase family protein n=1 Tax=Bacillus salitolerans TaxID=1437434 RepID=A0ABW4LW44_9BACI
MKLLILGGTKFLGRHLVEEAMKRGHEVTIFTRGKTNGAIFDNVEKLKGDRDGDISILKGRKWDAVIDTSGYVPRIVKESATLLSTTCKVYTFISSISVYKDFSHSGITEDAEVATLDDESVEEITGETYGALKALCEQEVKKVFPEGHLIIRPGLIVGPYDPTDRFTYWPMRIGGGDEVVVPEDKDAPVQFIDARDLSCFIIQQLEKKTIGTFQVTGPKDTLTMGEFLDETKDLINPSVKFTSVEDDFFEENGIQYWKDIPLYIPKGKNMDGFSAVNIEKAIQYGLTCRPISETITDTYAWKNSESPGEELVVGLTKSKEKEILELWKELKTS